MRVFIIVICIIILILGMWSVWKSAEISEIHKIRAAFHDHEELIRRNKAKLPKDYLEGFEKAEELLNEIEEEEKREKLI